jgi:HEAT repeat protein
MEYVNPDHRNTCRSLIGIRFLVLLIVLFALSGVDRPAVVSAQELGKLNRFLQNSNAQDGAMKVFRQGRDFIENGNWGRAAATFNSFIVDYPKHKDVDAAIYWLAFALKKEGKYSEADRQLERLISEHPRSSWIDDARAMRVEIAGQTGNSQVINSELSKSDRELKVIALQSLFMANPDRALEFVADLFKPNSKADRQLRENAVGLLGQHGGAKSNAMLSEIARGQLDPELRRNAIFWLAQRGGDAVVDELVKLYDSEQNIEVKKHILFSLSQNSSPRSRAKLIEVASSGGDVELRKQAIFSLGQRWGEGKFEELIKIYDADSNTEIRKQVLFVLSQTSDERSRAKLLDVARNATDVELRKQAIFWLGQRGGGQAISDLVQLYDAERDEQIKEQLIFALGQSRQKTALQKLMQIARNDPSVEMKKKAIFWLGQSRDPEAMKFIEEILK